MFQNYEYQQNIVYAGGPIAQHITMWWDETTQIGKSVCCIPFFLDKNSFRFRANPVLKQCSPFQRRKTHPKYTDSIVQMAEKIFCSLGSSVRSTTPSVCSKAESLLSEWISTPLFSSEEMVDSIIISVEKSRRQCERVNRNNGKWSRRLSSRTKFTGRVSFVLVRPKIRQKTANSNQSMI